MVTAEEGNTVRVDFVEMEAHDSELALAIESEFYRFESCVRAGAKRAYREARHGGTKQGASLSRLTLGVV